MWAYFLTGQDEYRRAALSAAQYVMNIEDGRRTSFRWLCRSNTGLSIESSAGYHGPGRASANSLHALLTGYELSGDAIFLRVAETLIRRVAHPADNLEAMDLLNAELRWFYTMHLQALIRYIELKRRLEQWDDYHHLATETLRHYVTWMAERERPTLDHPEQLQYPTETWVAQDMRKWHIFEYAAWLFRHEEFLKDRLQERADFFFDYVCRTLHAMPTRSLCRPVILMMQFGWQRHYFQQLRTQSNQPVLPVAPRPLLDKLAFEPQRSIAVRRAKHICCSAWDASSQLCSSPYGSVRELHEHRHGPSHALIK